jgi:hypothetical protein
MKGKLKRYEARFEKLKARLEEACNMEPIYTWEF